MGIPHSKVGEEIKQEEPQEGSVPSTPILTPKLRNLEELDPRSPSSNIVRTPIQVLLTPETISPASEDVVLTKCDTFNINSPAPKSFGIDPRSPTTDFQRTPIVLSETTKLPPKLYNKNLDNVRKTLLNATPKKITMSSVPPKLLQSSPLVLKPHENKRKSFIGLLETNLDYEETDLDAVYRNKTAPTEGTDTVIDNVTPINDSEVKQTDVACNEITEGNGSIRQENEENVAPIITDVTPKAAERKPKVDTTVADFDKKISTLIYTDEDVVSVSKTVKAKEGERTPLRMRNGQLKKATPKLKVSDKPRKSDYAVSKIPVFKDKKLPKQSENIPPKDLTSSKHTKRAQWDSNNTLIV